MKPLPELTEPGLQPAADDPTLLAVARDAIARRLGAAGVAYTPAAWLLEPGASFVTLTLNGDLRGCIGSLEAYRQLLEDVRANAVAAAVRDPRFPPLRVQELDATCIEVSLLSVPEAMEFTSQADAIARLRPGVDGVVLTYGQARGTFLPQVWDALPSPEEFLAQLKRKAGLPPGFWDDGIRLARYRVRKWREPERGAA
ncbi:MAG: AmmeMemoRadiSam system protein A [Pseudomonadota bacterium]